MMIGPEPRIRILEMSVRLGIYFSNSVIPTKSDDSLSESSGAWRDLLFPVRIGAAGTTRPRYLPRSDCVDGSAILSLFCSSALIVFHDRLRSRHRRMIRNRQGGGIYTLL